MQHFQYQIRKYTICQKIVQEQLYKFSEGKSIIFCDVSGWISKGRAVAVVIVAQLLY